MLFVDRDDLWAGTEESLQTVLGLELSALSVQQMRSTAETRTDQGDLPPSTILNTVNGVGVISIHGPLIANTSFLSRLFGLASYADIRQALVTAAQDPNVKRILLDVNSGGGAVAGVADTGDLIATINKIKPVTTFADGVMASAAYWLGSSAGKVTVSKTTLVGSIGVIAMHVERSKQFVEAGLTVTVFRAGKYKALVNQVEPLTEDAKEQMQTQLDAAYGIFVQHVADVRKVSYQVADSRMAQGREFFGAAAQDAGLVDSITTFDAVMKDLMDTQPVDGRSRMNQNQHQARLETTTIKGANDMKHVLSAEALEGAIAEGADLEELEAAAPPAPDASAEDSAEGSAESSSEDVGEAAEADAAATSSEPKPESEIVAFLRAQLKEKDEQVLSQAVELKGLKDRLEGVEATHTALADIARASISKMRVALGLPASDMAAVEPVALVAEHKRVSEEFKAKFKVGGVAVSQPEDKRVEAGANAAAPLYLAQVAAVRSAK